ncbi:MAG: hypothetical protein KDK39_17675, partial [Leptospiraceae bacterium]|nr:hypothetical protein [Leptospiraceae bacterium]
TPACAFYLPDYILHLHTTTARRCCSMEMVVRIMPAAILLFSAFILGYGYNFEYRNAGELFSSLALFGWILIVNIGFVLINLWPWRWYWVVIPGLALLAMQSKNWYDFYFPAEFSSTGAIALLVTPVLDFAALGAGYLVTWALHFFWLKDLP